MWQLMQRIGYVVSVLAIAMLAVDAAAAKRSPAAVARQVDEAIAREVFHESTQLAPPIDDETFLRRVWLDLHGDIPTPEELIAFVIDPASNKRQQVVRQLLDDPHYGQNWARYWRDVVLYRAQDEQRSRISANAMEVDLAERLNRGDGWDEIAAEFITARGDVQENGSTAIMMAQDGRTEETAAEISRIFLGIQIQCAQCHDHPQDRWKREQFHELAAFFPRVGVRNVASPTKRSFEVYANDRSRPRRRGNNDRLPQPEHTMPDLSDPNAPGTKIEPKFFLTGASVPLGTTDHQRRQQLAAWLTDNEWFAIALVNRLWSELVGEGFYEPIDDLGPDREATAPEAVGILSRGFRGSGYDLKWLLRTICQTEAYQRESRPRRGPEETPFVANVPQRLRSDQLFNAAHTALQIEERAGGPRRGNRRRLAEPRMQFAQVFGYDPSAPRDSVSASIPQILALMNAPQVDRLIVANGSNMISRLLRSIEEDRALVEELFLHCLSREPSAEELAAALAYREQVNNREEAFEDLLWSLINTAEFQHRR